MSLAVLRSRALTGIEAPPVSVEIHLANGLPAFNIVGLADTEVRESRERVRAALLNCDFDFPSRRITVNLAPADLPKESGRFDLAIALGILVASGQVPPTDSTTTSLPASSRSRANCAPCAARWRWPWDWRATMICASAWVPPRARLSCPGATARKRR